jgi:hypothetical protein
MGLMSRLFQHPGDVPFNPGGDPQTSLPGPGGPTPAMR